MVNLVNMSQRTMLLKVSIIMSWISICFCMLAGKSLRTSKIAWSLPSRTSQSRHRDNKHTDLQIINDKWMEKIQIRLEVKGVREKFGLR